MLRQHRLMRLLRERHGLIWEGFERMGPQRGVRQSGGENDRLGKNKESGKEEETEKWGMDIVLLGGKEGGGDRTWHRRP